MEYTDLPEATLLIGTWSSRCNSCGLGCSPKEKIHQTVLSYSNRAVVGVNRATPGCGIEWTHVMSSYMLPGIDEMVASIRPDLILIPIMPVPEPQ